ncbi:MAG: hypothetical protein AAGA66_12890 [Bacteroidota bacterium]
MHYKPNKLSRRYAPRIHREATEERNRTFAFPPTNEEDTDTAWLQSTETPVQLFSEDEEAVRMVPNNEEIINLAPRNKEIVRMVPNSEETIRMSPQGKEPPVQLVPQGTEPFDGGLIPPDEEEKITQGQGKNGKGKPVLPERPTVPDLPKDVNEFIKNVRPDFAEKFKESTDKGSVTQEARAAFWENEEQAISNMRESLRADFFIQKTDGAYRFDASQAAKALEKRVRDGELSAKEAFVMKQALEYEAGQILKDPQLDAFAFESQGAKKEAARQQQILKGKIEDALRKAKQKGVLGEFGEALDVVGTTAEVAGTLASASVVGAEIGVPLILVGKIVSGVGTGFQIVDDFQRLDPELARENALIRLSILTSGVVLSKGVDRLLTKELISRNTEVFIQVSIIASGKVAENRSIQK